MDSIDNYEAVVFLKNVHKHNIESDTDFIIENMEGKDAINILDVGYGSGILLKKMREKFNVANIFGVEKSHKIFDEMLNELKKYKVENFCSDFENWNTSVKFDIIIMSFYLHHINNVEIHINRALEYLKVNGKIIVVDRIAKDNNAKLEFIKYWHEYYKFKHEWNENVPALCTQAQIEKIIGKKNYIISKTMYLPNDNKVETINFRKTLLIIEKNYEIVEG